MFPNSTHNVPYGRVPALVCRSVGRRPGLLGPDPHLVVHAVQGLPWRHGQSCIIRGGGSPPFQGAQSVPSHCSPDGNCQLQWHL